VFGLNFTKNQQLALVALVGLSLIGLAVSRFRSTRQVATEGSAITITEPGKSGGTELIAPPAKPSYPRDEAGALVVHVAGCVRHPGVYTLKPGARIVDAIHAAGGPSVEANLDALNLAARARDGDQILLPPKQAAPASNAAVPVTIPPGPRAFELSPPALAVPQAAYVNVNTAGMEELDRLPGVGPATAQKIIDYRSRIGRFTSVEQLEEVKGIGPKKLEKMRPFVRL